jgi:hypothetical protein
MRIQQPGSSALAAGQVKRQLRRLSQLVFTFKTVGANNYSGLTNYSTPLRPRAGHTYAATVTYDAGLYDVEIREIDPRGAPGRKIEHRSLSSAAAPEQS